MDKTHVTAGEVLAQLEGTDAGARLIEEDCLVSVTPRYRMSEALRILKEAGLVPASAPFMYV